MRGAHEEQALARSVTEHGQGAAALAVRCNIVLTLLHDAGADDLATRITVTASDALYHELVRMMGAAVQEWREDRDT